MIITSLLGIFLVCLLIQLYYYLFFFSRLAFRKNKATSPSIMVPGVSVIVCAHNEAENLLQLLPKLYAQKFPAFEIIVVDDRSTDDTKKLLIEEKEKFKNLRIIRIDETPSHINSKKYALALAIKSAKHDALLLTDADCVPTSDEWLSSMTAPLQNAATKIVLGYSQYKIEQGFLNLFIRFETIYTGLQYLSLALAGRPYMGVGRNMAYSKNFFLEKKGFINHLKVTGGDDDLFVNKNGEKGNTAVVTGEKSLTCSIPKKTWKEYIIQKRRHLSVGKLYRFKDRLRLSILFLSQLFFWCTFVALLVMWQEPYLVIGGFVLRMGIQYLIFYKAAQTLGDKIKLWALPFLEVMYVLYYIATGISAVASRDIKWN